MLEDGWWSDYRTVASSGIDAILYFVLVSLRLGCALDFSLRLGRVLGTSWFPWRLGCVLVSLRLVSASWVRIGSIASWVRLVGASWSHCVLGAS